MTGRDAIRDILRRDPAWCAYALADLEPGFFEACEWLIAPGGTALVLLVRAFSPPVCFATGDAGDVAPLLQVADADGLSLQLRPEHVAGLGPRFRATALRSMWRMSLEPSAFRPASAPVTTVRLESTHVEAIGTLYADGADRHESPDFFFPSMVTQGIFFGILEGDRIVAVGGTHITSRAERVCTIGNVYTRADRRGRGYAAAVTSAVAAEALSQGITNIVLNVVQANTAAVRVYERLGFRCHCAFFEGKATRAGAEVRDREVPS